MLRKKVIYLIKNTPFESPRAREDLDLILMLAAFEVEITLIFIHAGVLQLLPTFAEKINARALTDVLTALPHYEITECFALDTSLSQYQVPHDKTIVPIRAITQSVLTQYIHDADYIF